jgi:hypothetical protein
MFFKLLHPLNIFDILRKFIALRLNKFKVNNDLCSLNKLDIEVIFDAFKLDKSIYIMFLQPIENILSREESEG